MKYPLTFNLQNKKIATIKVINIRSYTVEEKAKIFEKKITKKNIDKLFNEMIKSRNKTTNLNHSKMLFFQIINLILI